MATYSWRAPADVAAKEGTTTVSEVRRVGAVRLETYVSPQPKRTPDALRPRYAEKPPPRSVTRVPPVRRPPEGDRTETVTFVWR